MCPRDPVTKLEESFLVSVQLVKIELVPATFRACKPATVSNSQRVVEIVHFCDTMDSKASGVVRILYPLMNKLGENHAAIRTPIYAPETCHITRSQCVLIIDSALT